jgi:2-dehydro-3-deoxygluconokinase
MAEVVTLGETMVLLVPASDGTLDTVTQFSMTHGGAESNLGIGLVRLGHSVAWMSRLGADPFGVFLKRALAADGLDVSHVIVDPGAPTGVFFRERAPGLPPAGYYYRRGSAASRMQPSDLAASFFDGASILHCTGITPRRAEIRSTRPSPWHKNEACVSASTPTSGPGSPRSSKQGRRRFLCCARRTLCSEGYGR